MQQDFSQKTHKNLSVVLLALTDQESGALFRFKKGAGYSAHTETGRRYISPVLFFAQRRRYMGISTEEKERYLKETAIVLAREGFQTVRTHTGEIAAVICPAEIKPPFSCSLLMRAFGAEWSGNAATTTLTFKVSISAGLSRSYTAFTRQQRPLRQAAAT